MITKQCPVCKKDVELMKGFFKNEVRFPYHNNLTGNTCSNAYHIVKVTSHERKVVYS